MRISVNEALSRLNQEDGNIAKVLQEYDSAKASVVSFICDDGLSGWAYDAAKNYCALALVPFIESLIRCAQQKMACNNAYRDAVNLHLKGVSEVFDLTQLKWEYERLMQRRTKLRGLRKFMVPNTPADYALKSSIHAVDSSAAKIVHRIGRFQKFLSVTAAAYLPFRHACANARTNLAKVQDAHNAKEVYGAYAGMYVDWNRCYNPKRPIYMSDEEYEAYREQLIRDTRFLCESGWDGDAVSAYLDEVEMRMDGATGETWKEVLANTEIEAQQVGSPIYGTMFSASSLPSERKIELVLDHMGAELDENGNLQLRGGYKFYGDMPPHDKFLNDFCDCVIDAYGKTGLPDSELGAKIHGFRYYIDEHNIDYIRNHYKKNGMTDEDALIAYVDAELDGEKMLNEPARYHNRHFGWLPGDFERTYSDGLNKKRLTPDFHSEFIIDSKGNFVTEWDVLKRDESGDVIWDYEYYKEKYKDDPKAWRKAESTLANTESFNYADITPDAKRDGDVHDKLDVKPPGKYDPEVRNESKDNWRCLDPDDFPKKREKLGGGDDDYSTSVKEARKAMKRSAGGQGSGGGVR